MSTSTADTGQPPTLVGLLEVWNQSLEHTNIEYIHQLKTKEENRSAEWILAWNAVPLKLE
jgi:hypothetical protein